MSCVMSDTGQNGCSGSTRWIMPDNIHEPWIWTVFTAGCLTEEDAPSRHWYAQLLESFFLVLFPLSMDWDAKSHRGDFLKKNLNKNLCSARWKHRRRISCVRTGRTASPCATAASSTPATARWRVRPTAAATTTSRGPPTWSTAPPTESPTSRPAYPSVSVSHESTFHSLPSVFFVVAADWNRRSFRNSTV